MKESLAGSLFSGLFQPFLIDNLHSFLTYHKLRNSIVTTFGLEPGRIPVSSFSVFHSGLFSVPFDVLCCLYSVSAASPGHVHPLGNWPSSTNPGSS